MTSADDRYKIYYLSTSTTSRSLAIPAFRTYEPEKTTGGEPERPARRRPPRGAACALRATSGRGNTADSPSPGGRTRAAPEHVEGAGRATTCRPPFGDRRPETGPDERPDGRPHGRPGPALHGGVRCAGRNPRVPRQKRRAPDRRGYAPQDVTGTRTCAAVRRFAPRVRRDGMEDEKIHPCFASTATRASMRYVVPRCRLRTSLISKPLSRTSPRISRFQ